MRVKIKLQMILMVLIPMLISSLIIGITALRLSRSFLNNEQETILKVAIEGFSGDVNAFQEQEVDITVFEGDTRVESSVENVVGTKAGEAIIEKVLNGKEIYFSTNVDVNGTLYYGYYVPTETGMLFAGKSKSVVLGHINTLSNTIILIGVISILLYGSIGFFMAGNMANRIKSIAINIRGVADGNLTVRNEMRESKSGDEIADINNATFKMAQELSEIIKSVSGISEKVGTSSEELNATSDTTLASMGQVSKAIEEIAEGMQGQNRAVQNVAENINNVNVALDNIKTSSDRISVCSEKLDSSRHIMKKKVVSMSESNEKVNSSIGEVSDKIQSINSVIQKVKGIVSLIGDISEQTQLLSLNASIEAARAGDAGKGFSVVAQSISKLSEDTSSQVDQITNIIQTLVADFDECISIIDNTVEDSTQQKVDIDSVIGEFKELSSEIKETTDRVQQIGIAIDKSIEGVLSISQQMEELSSISSNSAAGTQQVNASVEEINALMEGVASTAEGLNGEIGKLSGQLEFFNV